MKNSPENLTIRRKGEIEYRKGRKDIVCLFQIYQRRILFTPREK